MQHVQTVHKTATNQRDLKTDTQKEKNRQPDKQRARKEGQEIYL